MGFTPAVCKEAGKAFRSSIKEAIYTSHTTDITVLSQKLNPIIRGWYNYFGRYNPSEAFKQGINYVNLRLVRWLMRTRKKVKRSWAKAQHLLHQIAKSCPEMYCHWKAGYMPVK